MSDTALDQGERAVLQQLSRVRPTADGDIIGKSQRDRLIARGLAFRAAGHTTLTLAGQQVQDALSEPKP
jgi:hypothetical protein